MSIFEVCMLACFGAAWPFSILRSYRARSNKGKSLFFLLVLVVGYIFGILHKIFYSFDIVLLLYCLNLTMISTDVYLYFRNRRIEKAERRR
ncbi:MAG: hypothetical protein E7328_02515 [Clostridiales bacterium]|nr:hypothetical protein [Clostridiales bacterium]